LPWPLRLLQGDFSGSHSGARDEAAYRFGGADEARTVGASLLNRVMRIDIPYSAHDLIAEINGKTSSMRALVSS
jgi:hypothetical protein